MPPGRAVPADAIGAGCGTLHIDKANSAVKGGGDDPEYALEKTVVAVARAARLAA